MTWKGDAGLSAVSPQLPGFSYGRPTRTEFIADYEKLWRDAGVLGDVLGHEQRRFASPEGTEYVIRVAKDEHNAERTELAWASRGALETELRHQQRPPSARSANSSQPANAPPSWSDGLVCAPTPAACGGRLAGRNRGVT